jgi:hypothetical protein
MIIGCLRLPDCAQYFVRLAGLQVGCSQLMSDLDVVRADPTSLKQIESGVPWLSLLKKKLADGGAPLEV